MLHLVDLVGSILTDFRDRDEKPHQYTPLFDLKYLDLWISVENLINSKAKVSFRNYLKPLGQVPLNIYNLSRLHLLLLLKEKDLLYADSTHNYKALYLKLFDFLQGQVQKFLLFVCK